MAIAERRFDHSRWRLRLGPTSTAVVIPRPYLPARVYLVGFMGSGKTTVGRLLADRLEWTFIDLDRLVEERAGLSVRRIFALGGEGRFRSAEHDALRDASHESGRAIVALGGGAFSSEVNRALVRRSGVSVWIDVPFRSLVRRVAGDRRRPLAGDRDRLFQLFRARLPFYHEADVRVRAGDATADHIAADVLKTLREDWSIVAERRRLFP